MAGERISPNVKSSIESNVEPMSSIGQASISPATAWSVEIAGHDRWAIYQRLQSLAIDCHCGVGAPLTVQINSPHDLIQCWSVMRHAAGGDRLAQAAALETCWRLDVKL
jgi:hypothetical protein